MIKVYLDMWSRFLTRANPHSTFHAYGKELSVMEVSSAHLFRIEYDQVGEWLWRRRQTQ